MSDTLYDRHRELLERAARAIGERTFYTPYPEHHGAYPEDAWHAGKVAFEEQLGKPFEGLLQAGSKRWVGGETSPYTTKALGIAYPCESPDELVDWAEEAWKSWRQVPVTARAGLLAESLERLRERFFAMAYATMHTTGQSFMMAFQASGPHACDRAMEAVALGLQEMTRFPETVDWEKPVGKSTIRLAKRFKPVPRGIGLVIGCSTFPVWNSIPGLYANLMAGNPVILKPHPGAVLPIAMVVAELQQLLHEQQLDPLTVQLAADSADEPLAKTLAQHDSIKLIDYTGGSVFGNYLESLPGKVTFTEKSGINSVIIDSVTDLDAVLQNLAFSLALYSGQMCTAPQNFFIPAEGVREGEELVPYAKVVERFRQCIQQLVNHPKLASGTLAAIQCEATLKRAQEMRHLGVNLILEPHALPHPEFEHARTCTPVLGEVEARNSDAFDDELFGPIALIIKTEGTAQSIRLASEIATRHGAITCAAYTTDKEIEEQICSAMEAAFTPVSLNLTGYIWVNQAAGFSDFHVSGGNPAGNAAFVNPEYLNKRFVWIGHRKLLADPTA